ncbi:MAG UNVERIFIED_CONTAM: pyruvate, phosphate dikinase [Rickettsiaceae bacterium]
MGNNLPNKSLLGNKGLALFDMSLLGVPVPPGFTISTDLCKFYYQNNKRLPENFENNLLSEIEFLEQVSGKIFGGENPLLVSVRSGAKESMPGMMDTVLNIGLNDTTVAHLANLSGNKIFALDSYRRLLHAYGSLVLGIHSNVFEKILDNADLKNEDVLENIIASFKEIILEKTGSDFPQDVRAQLNGAVIAVLESWMSERAKIYRVLHDISEEIGTAVTIQSMVFGNKGEDSATGVLFSRNPSNGNKELYGEYIINAQGEDIVAGTHTPLNITDSLAKKFPSAYIELANYASLLEKHYKDMQDIEFTIEEKKLYILQTRRGKRSASSAIKIAVDMVHEDIINKEEAILSIDPIIVNQLLHARINYDTMNCKPIARGLAASPGAAIGMAVFSPYDAEELAHHHKIILVRRDTSPEDIKGMHLSEGILTIRGGITSHAAVVARGMGKPCVCGTENIIINEVEKSMKIGDLTIKQGDMISIDGDNGNVFYGALDLVSPEFTSEFALFMEWVDQERALKVRANAENILDSKTAIRLGAEGIGLCRTEHMFFSENKIALIREMIISPDMRQRESALNKLLPIHKDDFKDIFRLMNNLPVNVRLLDPPLHEFLPQNDLEKRNLVEQLNLPWVVIEKRLHALHEVNPMLGHRGCRLGITFPEIYEMQVEAIFLALEELKSENIKISLEIMLPLICEALELKNLKSLILRVAEKCKVDFEYKIGVMIELPRAALQADKLGPYVDYFSFGTNDLTQTTFGISRDDVASFIPDYISKEILPNDPFIKLDQVGVGELVKIAIERGKSTNPAIGLGVCGEHGGDPSSIQFFHDIGLNYVSCSPYRIPIARIAAAQANIRNKRR